MWYYGGLNGNTSHWFIGNGTIGRYGLVGWCVGFQKPKASPMTHFLFLLPEDQR